MEKENKILKESVKELEEKVNKMEDQSEIRKRVEKK